VAELLAGALRDFGLRCTARLRRPWSGTYSCNRGGATGSVQELTSGLSKLQKYVLLQTLLQIYLNVAPYSAC